MKVSAVLVGVNVAATLSVAGQHPALAQDQTPTSGTAAFLKSSIAPAPVSLSAAPALSLSPGAAKVSLSSPRSVATRKALAQNHGVKLREFVPNRRLPSKHDIESASMAAQSPEIDNSYQPTTLDGGVAEYSPYYMSGETQDVPMSPRAKYAVKQQQKKTNSERLHNAAKVASSFVRQVAPRAVPGGMPAVPGSVGFPCAETSFNNLQNPMPMHREVPQHPMMQQMPRPQMPMQFAQQQFSPAPQAPVQPPRLSPQEQLEMNKLVDSACLEQGINPHAPGIQGNPDLYSRVGPPPFPLSLIPEDTMKGFLKGARNRKSPIAGSGLSMASGGGVGMGSTQHLPAAGFHTYMAQTSSQGFGNYSRLPTAMPVSKHPVHQPGRAVHHPQHQTKKISSAPTNLSIRPETPKTQVQAQQTQQVLTYPPYRSQVNFGS
jgi:hypothetical protein